MRTLLSFYRQNDEPNWIYLSEPAFHSIRSRKDYSQVFDYLASKDFMVVNYADTNTPQAIHLNPAGITFLEDQAAAFSERWWTRGLSIAALIIALISLFLELEDRGIVEHFKRLLFEDQSAVSMLPKPSEEPVSTINDLQTSASPPTPTLSPKPRLTVTPVPTIHATQRQNTVNSDG